MSNQTKIQKYRAMLENLSEQPENLMALEEIAENGNADVMYILGWCYFKGEYLAKDLGKSQYWLEKAKQSGHEQATELLVYCQFLIFMETNHTK